MTSQPVPDAAEPDLALWLRWVLANTGAELVGLGGSGLVMLGFFTLSDRAETVGTILLQALAAILLGTLLEGVVVGVAQWLVLRRALPRMPWREWVIATSVGAGIAWLFGMIPSTIIGISQLLAPPTVPEPVAEPAQSTMLLGAAALGFLLGPVLGFGQYLSLGRYVKKAGWWILANAVAWAVSMTIVFAGVGAVPDEGTTWRTIAILAFSTASAGAAAGAIHGAVLLRLLRLRRAVRLPLT